MKHKFIVLIFLMFASCKPPNNFNDDKFVALTPTRTSSNTPTSTITSPPSLTPTHTATPSPSQTLTPTITQTHIHPLGEPVFHEADEEIAYNWFSYVPPNLNKEDVNYIIVTGLHGNITSGDYEEVTSESKDHFMSKVNDGNDFYQEFIILVPVIPRKPDNPHIYSVAFDLNSFLSWVPDFYQRADLKVNLMIDKLLQELKTDGYNVSNKVFVEGFSAGCLFAARYVLLHPERVQAIAGGGCAGTLTLPEAEYNGIKMNWPVGINNLSDLVGYEFNRSAYEQVAQFIYNGMLDDNTIVWPYDWGPQDMWESVSQLYFLNENFGETNSERLENQINYLHNLGYSNIFFKSYPGIGHDQTPEMIRDFQVFILEHR